MNQSNKKGTHPSWNSERKRQKNPVQIWAKDLNRHFMKEKIQMANKLLEKWSTSFVIREVQIETVMRYNASAMMVDIKITDSVKCW